MRRHLTEHSVDTLAERGWSDKSNGEMLDLGEGDGYEVLVTTDQSLQHQQNLANRRIGIVVLLANAWARVRLQAGEIRKAITAVPKGEALEGPIRPEQHAD